MFYIKLHWFYRLTQLQDNFISDDDNINNWFSSNALITSDHWAMEVIRFWFHSQTFFQWKSTITKYLNNTCSKKFGCENLSKIFLLQEELSV